MNMFLSGCWPQAQTGAVELSGCVRGCDQYTAIWLELIKFHHAAEQNCTVYIMLESRPPAVHNGRGRWRPTRADAELREGGELQDSECEPIISHANLIYMMQRRYLRTH